MRRENFYPLTLLRDVGELRCGARTVADHPERKLEYLWDLIVNLKFDLETDLADQGSRLAGQIHPSAVLINKEKMIIEEGVEVQAGAVLDASRGPIYLAKNTVVKAQAFLSGPLSIGPECRIGGEVSHSIFHGYSNKAHYGFIGHSYVGEWVNLGAGTTNSNLKNTYGTVKINLNGKTVDSGQQFLGCFIGDYAKLGIGTLIPTGGVIGVGAQLFGGGLIPKKVPDFAWGDQGKIALEKFLAIARAMADRRNQSLSEKEVAVLSEVWRRS